MTNPIEALMQAALNAPARRRQDALRVLQGDAQVAEEPDVAPVNEPYLIRTSARTTCSGSGRTRVAGAWSPSRCSVRSVRRDGRTGVPASRRPSRRRPAAWAGVGPANASSSRELSSGGRSTVASAKGKSWRLRHESNGVDSQPALRFEPAETAREPAEKLFSAAAACGDSARNHWPVSGCERLSEQGFAF